MAGSLNSNTLSSFICHTKVVRVRIRKRTVSGERERRVTLVDPSFEIFYAAFYIALHTASNQDKKTLVRYASLYTGIYVVDTKLNRRLTNLQVSH